MSNKKKFGDVNIEISNIKGWRNSIVTSVGSTNSVDPRALTELGKLMSSLAALEREAAPVMEHDPKVRRAVTTARKRLDAASERAKAGNKASLARKLEKAKDAVSEVGTLANATASAVPKIAGAAAKIGTMASSIGDSLGHIFNTLAGH